MVLQCYVPGCKSRGRGFKFFSVPYTTREMGGMAGRPAYRLSLKIYILCAVECHKHTEPYASIQHKQLPLYSKNAVKYTKDLTTMKR